MRTPAVSRSAAMLLLAALAACGGGGDGGGGDGSTDVGSFGGGAAPLVYVGNSAAAIISVNNANALLGNAFGSDEPTAAASGVLPAGQPTAKQGHIGIDRRVVRTARSALASHEERSRAVSVAVDEIEQCAGGGTQHIAGDVRQDRTGTVNATWTNCKDEEGDVLHGTATLRIDAYDAGSSMATDYTITFGRLALRGESNIDLTGSIRLQSNPATNTETRTANITVLEIATGLMTKIENLVVVETYDDLFAPSSYSQSITGRAYDPTHGFVDIATPVKLGFKSVDDEFPSSGELRLFGAAGSSIAITASPAVVRIAVDADGNGVFERQARLSWNDVGGPAGANLSDTDGDGMHDSWESVYGLDPALPDHNGDLDGDGSTNLAEYLAGSRPNVR